MNAILEMIYEDDAISLQRGIGNGIPVDLQVDEDTNLLQYAVWSGAVRCTEILIKNGADVYAVDRQGQTLLHKLSRSSRESMPEMIAVLCRAGLSLNRRDSEGNTPFSLLLRGKHCDDRVVFTALEHGADPKTENSYALYKCKTGDMMRLLVKDGAELDVKDTSGTPLLHGITGQTTEKLAVALELGADLNAADESGSTALHLVASKPGDEQVEKAALLLEAGVHVNAKDGQGNTPLHCAANKWLGHTGMVELLLSHGADRDVANSNGEKPVDLARNTRAGYNMKVELLQ